jgi:hypothetical protein
MKSEEFYVKYANMPLEDRKVVVGGAFTISRNSKMDIIYGMNANDIYQEIHAIDDKIRDDIIRKDKLIRAFAEFIEKNEKLYKKIL